MPLATWTGSIEFGSGNAASGQNPTSKRALASPQTRAFNPPEAALVAQAIQLRRRTCSPEGA